MFLYSKISFLLQRRYIFSRGNAKYFLFPDEKIRNSKSIKKQKSPSQKGKSESENMFLKLLEQWITSKGVQMYDLIFYSTSYYKSNTNFIQSDKKTHR